MTHRFESNEDDPAINPYAPTAEVSHLSQVSAAQEDWPPPLSIRLVQIMAVILMIGCPIGAGFAFWDIETIMGSGPILSILALLILICYLATRRRSALNPWHGWQFPCVTVALAIGVFLVIYFKEWSPDDAQKPISWAFAGYAAFAQVGWLLLKLKRPTISE
ncbi:hypothetical protein SV7mr_35750 [Stieleria bergensis]|uniref:Transmembrane protein n=1 Tax=Stieleria bergensis TaxID=2528025 RepID=A0A517SY25_9BACT|nr:hypothetical protein SV7mr_35750 [Planctomycetes bacterium SV_7m_r]